jgi:lipoyl(octanoyl) transferase
VNTDLGYFDHIIPCGIVNKKVTSLAAELGHEIPMDEVKNEVRNAFFRLFS